MQDLKTDDKPDIREEEQYLSFASDYFLHVSKQTQNRPTKANPNELSWHNRTSMDSRTRK